MIGLFRIVVAFILGFTLFPCFSQTTSYDPAYLHPPDRLKDDLSFVKKELEKRHPALYRYITKTALDDFFDSLAHAIVKPMNEQEFLGLICLLNEKICDGHTMFLPSENATDYNSAKGKFFPFSVFYDKEKLYVTENCSNDSTIHGGDEILRLNGVEANGVMKQLFKRQIRDGRNFTYPVWILNHYFSSYYSFSFGQPAFYLLELQRPNGEIYSKQVDALERPLIRAHRQERYPQSVVPLEGKGITLEDSPDSGYAVLTIKSFDPAIISGTYKQNFKQDLASAFITADRIGIKNLILDLRDNQGGDFETGRYLLSYLVDRPVKYLVSGKESRMIQPKANRFGGKLIVLINGGSFSNSGIVSSILQETKRAVFVGEESGGNKSLISGEPIERKLPNTRISSYISTELFQIRENIKEDTGVIPDYVVKSTIEDVLSRKDAVKLFAIKIISEK